MKRLNDILDQVVVLAKQGTANPALYHLQMDSRLCSPGTLFFAIKGTQSDGHQFIDNAIRLGACVVVCETLPDNLIEDCTYIQVENSAFTCGMMASNFYNNPSSRLKLIGVTGTNGKTTCVSLLHQLVTSMGFQAGLLSTVENKIGTKILPSTHTTPDQITLHHLLAQMVEAGCAYAFMEVSSHAIHQNRISGAQFAVGLFTNISHDHLDYHKTFDAYIQVKKHFFDHLPTTAFAITNLDDKRGTVMLQNTVAIKKSYSVRTLADFKAKILENNLSGLVLNLDNQEVHFKLIGEFNAYNLLAVYAVGLCLGLQKTEILQHLSALDGAEGRFETVRSKKDNILGIVDYAHTPDALINVLATLNKLRHHNETLHTIIGCGGDRDKTKRPIMALVACEHADKIIFTSDNPRTENAEEIINDMEAGVPASLSKKYLSITNRKDAIKTACGMAQKGDIILLAGKGHEKYQEVNGVKNPFDDKEILTHFLELMDK